jgi:hypothetical protein
MYRAGDVRVETVPDPVLREPTDAIVRVTSACICGSDLWPYQSMPANEQGRRMGHEFIGIVEEAGADVGGFAPGDLVVAPFVWSDNTCDFCTEGLQMVCRHGGQWGSAGGATDVVATRGHRRDARADQRRRYARRAGVRRDQAIDGDRGRRMSKNSCPTSSTAPSSRDGCSTAPSASTRFPRATRPWTTAKPSRSSSALKGGRQMPAAAVSARRVDMSSIWVPAGRPFWPLP